MAFVSCKQVVAAACDKSLRKATTITIGRESRALRAGRGWCLAAWCWGGLWCPTCLPACAMRSASLHGCKTVGAATAGLVLWGREWGKESRKPGWLARLHPPSSMVLLPRQSGGHAVTSLGKGKQEKVSRESVWWGISFPLGGEVRLQWEAQPTEGAVQLGVQVHCDPVQCHFCTYGI